MGTSSTVLGTNVNYMVHSVEVAAFIGTDNLQNYTSRYYHPDTTTNLTVSMDEWPGSLETHGDIIGVKEMLKIQCAANICPSKSLLLNTATPLEPDGPPAYIGKTKKEDLMTDDLKIFVCIA